jgi:antibiotic biosynthesis monooxygenase (ABM) superfamily enzyme
MVSPTTQLEKDVTIIQASSTDQLAAAAAPPSTHVRAIITWLAIFPLVAIGVTSMAPLTSGWHPVVRSFVLTLIVVPLAVYVVVPRLLALYQRMQSKR